MTIYQLAKLVHLSGGLESRKRIQKTVHLVQAAGCDFGLDFRLHYYGPYSAELAEQLNRMTTNEILLESQKATSVGTQYNYQFKKDFLQSLECYERTSHGTEERDGIEKHQTLINELKHTNPKTLELASTVVAFRQAERAWDEAVQEAAEFKGENTDSATMARARSLAEKVIGFGDG